MSPNHSGDGCPIGTVDAIKSPGNEALTLLFSGYKSSTSRSRKNVKKSCNVAVPVSVQKGYSVTIYKTGKNTYDNPIL